MRISLRRAGLAAVLMSAAGMLAACGGGEPEGADEARQIALDRCIKQSGQEKLCGCVLDKMQAQLSGSDHEEWVKLTLAASETGLDIDRAAASAGMSREAFIETNNKFAKIGASAGIDCASGTGFQ